MHPQPSFSSVVAASLPSLPGSVPQRLFCSVFARNPLGASNLFLHSCPLLCSPPLSSSLPCARPLSPTFLLRREPQLRHSPCPHLSPRSSEGPSRLGFGSNPCLLCAAFVTIAFYLFSHFHYDIFSDPRGFLGLCFWIPKQWKEALLLISNLTALKTENSTVAPECLLCAGENDK